MENMPHFEEDMRRNGLVKIGIVFSCLLLVCMNANANTCDLQTNNCWEQMMKEGQVPPKNAFKGIDTSKLNKEHLQYYFHHYAKQSPLKPTAEEEGAIKLLTKFEAQERTKINSFQIQSDDRYAMNVELRESVATIIFPKDYGPLMSFASKDSDGDDRNYIGVGPLAMQGESKLIDVGHEGNIRIEARQSSSVLIEQTRSFFGADGVKLSFGLGGNDETLTFCYVEPLSSSRKQG